MKNFLKIKNKYIDQERISFSLEIVKCSGENCKSESEISKLLEGIHFSVLTLGQDIELGNSQNYGKSPLKVIDNFHS